MRSAVGHNKQGPLLHPFPVIRMNVVLSCLHVNCMDWSVILLLDVLFFGRRLDDVQLAALEVEE